MKEVLITFKAGRSMIKESRLCSCETGGILNGTLDPLTIVAAGSPGPNLTQQVARFTSDPQADRECLDNARKQFGDKIGLVGYWHKHPEGFVKPSSRDCQQVRQLIHDYDDGQPVLMGIVNHHPKGVRHKTDLHLYSIEPKDELLEHPWKLVGNKNKLLLEAIKRAPAKPDPKPSGYWQDNDFQSYLNPVGRERIRKEVEHLENTGWSVTTSRRKHDKVMILDIVRNSHSLRLLLPPEFPLNAPVVLTADGKKFLGLEAIRSWNSLNPLSRIAAEAEAVMNCSRCYSQCIEHY